MIFVDELQSYPQAAVSRRFGPLWCHLWSDTDDEELHAFALKIGLKRSWFQGHHRRREFHHYDLTPRKRELALTQGAQQMSALEHGRKIACLIEAENSDLTNER